MNPKGLHDTFLKYIQKPLTAPTNNYHCAQLWFFKNTRCLHFIQNETWCTFCL